MRFLIDAQLPVGLAGWIISRGHQAEHVVDLALLTASDQEIWHAALAAGAIVLTQDHDFVEWATTRRPAPPVVWVRIGNATNATLIARLDAVWDKIIESLEAGVQVIEASGP